MIYIIESSSLVGFKEINADTLTDEENALLMRLFEMGHGPLDLLSGASIRLSFDRDRTQTHDEWRQEKAAELEEMCRRVKG